MSTGSQSSNQPAEELKPASLYQTTTKPELVSRLLRSTWPVRALHVQGMTSHIKPSSGVSMQVTVMFTGKHPAGIRAGPRLFPLSRCFTTILLSKLSTRSIHDTGFRNSPFKRFGGRIHAGNINPTEGRQERVCLCKIMFIHIICSGNIA